jgi:enamine deaminase RidA (YjgF/YER057c/UK114 family)
MRRSRERLLEFDAYAMRKIGVLVLCALAAHAGPFDKKKKSDDDATQVLQLPKDPPSAVVAETARLVFHVSPLSSKGLLSPQVRDALKALQHSVGSATVVKLRAFVAGSGDLRRVQAIVSETFTDRHLPLPALSVVQAGGLPLEGAQVVLEAISVGKKDVNPNGLVFIAGQQASAPSPLEPVLPLAEKALAGLRTAVRGSGSEAGDVLRGTCFLSSFDGFAKVRELVDAEYHGAVWNFVQIQREPPNAVVECEAVARARVKIDKPIEFLNPDGLAKSPNYSQIALVGAPRVAITGTQVAFGNQDADVRLAFGRLQKELAGVGASIKEIAWSSIYPLSNAMADEVRKIRFEYYDAARPPASTLVPFEGLPSLDASFAVDAIAVTSR